MFRLRGLYFTIGTLALAEALRILIVNLPAFGGTGGIVLASPAPAAYALYWWALAVAVVSTAVVMAIMASPLSLSLRAVRDDEQVARQLGVVTFRTKLWAFSVAAALMGMVGGLQAAKLGVIEPYGSFGLSWTVDIVAVAIIGGMGTRLGPFIGAAFIVVPPSCWPTTPKCIWPSLVACCSSSSVRPKGIWGSAVAWTVLWRAIQPGR
jgi:branched-chain amino acid transport system permease protein